MQLWSGSVFFLTISQSAEVEVATKEYSHEINAPPTQHTHWPSEGASYIQIEGTRIFVKRCYSPL